MMRKYVNKKMSLAAARTTRSVFCALHSVVGWHRRLQRTRHYSVLHSRYHDNNADMVTNLLAESDDDDDALIDPMNLESAAHHRLALNEHDDDEPLCKWLLETDHHFRFISHFPGEPGSAGSSWFSFASSGKEPLGISDTGFWMGRLPFLLPKQQRQNTKGNSTGLVLSSTTSWGKQSCSLYAGFAIPIAYLCYLRYCLILRGLGCHCPHYSS